MFFFKQRVRILLGRREHLSRRPIIIPETSDSAEKRGVGDGKEIGLEKLGDVCATAGGAGSRLSQTGNLEPEPRSRRDEIETNLGGKHLLSMVGIRQRKERGHLLFQTGGHLFLMARLLRLGGLERGCLRTGSFVTGLHEMEIRFEKRDETRRRVPKNFARRDLGVHLTERRRDGTRLAQK